MATRKRDQMQPGDYQALLQKYKEAADRDLARCQTRPQFDQWKKNRKKSLDLPVELRRRIVSWGLGKDKDPDFKTIGIIVYILAKEMYALSDNDVEYEILRTKVDRDLAWDWIGEMKKFIKRKARGAEYTRKSRAKAAEKAKRAKKTK